MRKKRIQRVVSTTIIASFLISLMGPASSIHGYAEKISLVTKKLKNGTTHCIWLISDRHEIYTDLGEKTKRYIIKKGRQNIKEVAQTLGATVYVEDAYDFTSMPDYNKEYCKYIKDNKQMMLTNFLSILKKQNIPAVNIENRPMLHQYYKNKNQENEKILIYFLVFSYAMILSSIAYLYSDKKTAAAILPLLLMASTVLPSNKKEKKLTLYKEIEKNKHEDTLSELVHRWKQEDLQEFNEWKKENFKEWKTQSLDKYHPNWGIKKQANNVEMLMKYCYYNDAFTMTKILHKLEQRKHKRGYVHDIVATGGFHTKRIKDSFKKDFGYTKQWSISTPAYKERNERRRPDIILNIKRCFEDGLKQLQIKT